MNVEKELEEIFKDPLFASDEIWIGDVVIIKWEHAAPKYQACIDGNVVAEGEDLFEVLRRTFC